MLIWVILELSPTLRYKKHYVLPAGFIPGPGKPKNLDTFLFPALEHISALQRKGLKVWDAASNQIVTKYPLVFLGTADAPGAASMSGVVGYKGMKGCRNYCGLKTRHIQGAPQYYPALLNPSGPMPHNSSHPDIDLTNQSPYFSQSVYNQNATNLLSVSVRDFESNHKIAGLTKPSIFNGLHIPALGAPGAFPLDIMHLFALNIPDLLSRLWQGTLRYDKKSSDTHSDWPWKVLIGDQWKKHGDKVVSFRPYLPYTYECPPRNPAEKLNSRYKAAEWNTYFWGYLPALLDGVLPNPYYQNFCKLVHVVRLISQRKITDKELDEVQHLVVDFLTEYEVIMLTKCRV